MDGAVCLLGFLVGVAEEMAEAACFLGLGWRRLIIGVLALPALT
jgi:hypothetical protein